jgi:hypothetical protein
MVEFSTQGMADRYFDRVLQSRCHYGKKEAAGLVFATGGFGP